MSEQVQTPKSNKKKKPIIHSVSLKSFDLAGAMDSLPDPDIILERRGLTVKAYKDLLRDDHLMSVWDTRIGAVSGQGWNLSDTGNAKALDFVTELFKRLDVPTLIENILNAVAWGYQPFEMLWTKDGNYWSIDDLSAKPSEWFAYDVDGNLKVRRGYNVEAAEDNRFLVARNKPSYDNPYGVKAFASCFWPVKLKHKGIDWYTEFLEKYGSLFLVGKYPAHATQKYQGDLLAALDMIIGSGVTTVEDGTQIEVLEANSKKSSSDVYTAYKEMFEGAISKVILGQTLTTDTGKNGGGSYSLGKVHNEIRLDRTRKDKQLVTNFMNEFLNLICSFNFGDGTAPQFNFVSPKEVSKERAEIYRILYDMGVQVDLATIADKFDLPLESLSLKENDNIIKQDHGLNLQFEKQNQSEFNQSLNSILKGVNEHLNNAKSYEEALGFEVNVNPLGELTLNDNFKKTVMAEAIADEEK